MNHGGAWLLTQLEAWAGEGAVGEARGVLAGLRRGVEGAGGGAAVHHQGVAGDEGRRVAGQEQGRVGDVERLADLGQRLSVDEFTAVWGRTLEDAIRAGKAYVTAAIQGGLAAGHGVGVLRHFIERW